MALNTKDFKKISEQYSALTSINKGRTTKEQVEDTRQSLLGLLKDNAVDVSDSDSLKNLSNKIKGIQEERLRNHEHKEKLQSQQKAIDKVVELLKKVKDTPEIPSLQANNFGEFIPLNKFTEIDNSENNLDEKSLKPAISVSYSGNYSISKIEQGGWKYTIKDKSGKDMGTLSVTDNDFKFEKADNYDLTRKIELDIQLSYRPVSLPIKPLLSKENDTFFGHITHTKKLIIGRDIEPLQESKNLTPTHRTEVDRNPATPPNEPKVQDIKQKSIEPITYSPISNSTANAISLPEDQSKISEGGDRNSISKISNASKKELFSLFTIDANVMDKENLILEAERNRISDISERKYMKAHRPQKIVMFGINRWMQKRDLNKVIDSRIKDNNFIEEGSLQNRIEGNIGTYSKQSTMGINNNVTREDLGEEESINNIAHLYMMNEIDESTAIREFNKVFTTTPRLRMGNMTGTDIMSELKDPSKQRDYKINQALLPYTNQATLSSTDITEIQNKLNKSNISSTNISSSVISIESNELQKKFDLLKGAMVSNNISKISAGTMKIRVKLRGLTKAKNTEELEGIRYDKLEKDWSEKIAKLLNRGGLGGWGAKAALGIGLGAATSTSTLGILGGVTFLGVVLQRAKSRRDAIKEIAKTHEDAINLGIKELEERIEEVQKAIDNNASVWQKSIGFMGMGARHRAEKQKKILSAFAEMRGTDNTMIQPVETLIANLQNNQSNNIGPIADVLARIDAGHHYQTQFISTGDGGREQTAIKRKAMMESLQAACIRNGHVPQKPTAEQRNTCRQKIHGTPEYQKTISELSQKYEKLETEIKSQKQSIATNAAGNYMKNVAAATVVTAGLGSLYNRRNSTPANVTPITTPNTPITPHEHTDYNLGKFDDTNIVNRTTGLGNVDHGQTISIEAEAAVDAVKAHSKNSFADFQDHLVQTNNLIDSSAFNQVTKDTLHNALSQKKVSEIMQIAADAGADIGNRRLVVERRREGIENIIQELSNRGMTDVTISSIEFKDIGNMGIQASTGGQDDITHRGFEAIVNVVSSGEDITTPSTPRTFPISRVPGALPFFNTYALPGRKTDYAGLPKEKKYKVSEGKSNRWDNKYKPSNINNSPIKEDIKQRVSDISKNIITINNGKIETDKIVAVPIYAGEERTSDLVKAIKNQKGDFKAVLYVNGPKENISKEVFDDKVRELQRITQDDSRFIIVGNHYDNKVTIGTIRADMMDSIDESIDHSKVSNPKIIGLDADTYKLDDNYIQGMGEKMDEPGVNWLSGNLRWYDENEAKGDEFSFIQERMFDAAGLKHKVNKNIYLSGGSFGLRLNEYKRIGGFNRHKGGGEDSELGDRFVANGSQGTVFGKKVYVDPRRGQDAVNQGKHFGAQREKDFKPIGLFDKKTASEAYKDLTKISAKLLYGETLEENEKKAFEESLNRLPLWGVKNGVVQNGSSSDMGMAIKRWNTQTKSAYKMISRINPSNNKLEIKLISREDFAKLST